VWSVEYNRRAGFEISDAETLKLILKACKDCKQEPTEEYVRWLFHYETGRDLDGEIRGTTHAPPEADASEK